MERIDMYKSMIDYTASYTDQYQLTMSQVYFLHRKIGTRDENIAVNLNTYMDFALIFMPYGTKIRA
ncbi:MAG TPA: hypothetical protein VJ203_06010 [Bacteroidales bacterium]|nr:hypothetical protein [Bacteroidales bacterium]